MELVRVDRREVPLGAEAGHVDGVLAVGEDLLVLARFRLALAPRVRRALREPRGAALVVLPLVALGRRPAFSKSESTTLTSSTRRHALCTTEESAYLLRPLVRFPGVVGSTFISFGQVTALIDF